jgi:CheY-like chemotaxis protein
MSAILLSAESILQSMERFKERDCNMMSVTTEDTTLNILDGDLATDKRNVIEAAQTVLYCIEYQKRIIEDVLVLSKLDADMLEFTPIPVRPLDIIRHTRSLFDREFKLLDVHVSIKEDSSIKKHGLDWTFLDPSRFLQILMNLLTNAIDSIREADIKQIAINVSVSDTKPITADYDFLAPTHSSGRALVDSRSPSRPPLGDMKYLIIQVTDSGKGFSDQERKKLLDRFSSPKTHVKYGEAGLGLFIARRIIEMMGGQIGIPRNQSLGNSFMYFIETRKTDQESSIEFELDKKMVSTLAPLPMTASSAELLQARKTRQNSMSDPGSYASRRSVRRLLVVEDNLINQRVLCKQLKGHGYQVVAANHGVEALEALIKALREESYFDIVLCDIEMPIMNGIQCVKEIRRLEAADILHGHLPVLAVTANARNEHVEQALDAGMDGVTTKPYRIDQLIAEIEKYAHSI